MVIISRGFYKVYSKFKMELKKNILRIERELGEFDNVKFSFRYLNVDDNEREIIEKELSDLNLKVNKIETEDYVITFPLTKEIDSERIKMLNDKMKLSSSKYGIYIAFTTNYDHAGFRLPDKIKEFYQKVGGEFDCSIITLV